MPASEVILTIVLVVAGLACSAVVWACLEAVKTMQSVRVLSDDARTRLVPLLEKADVTVDAVNAELLRVDAIITRFEEAGERVSSASGTIHGIVNAPTELVNEMALRVRKAWRGRRHEAAEQTEAAAGSASRTDAGGPQVEAAADHQEDHR